jgi:outer membrane PBP1 activator LpoA protein
VDSEKEAVGAAEQNKQSPFMVRVKELQIDRLRVIFNKLSVTVESQQAAVKSLLEKIIIANKESPEFLRYVLYKVAYNLSSDCQEEFFNEMDEVSQGAINSSYFTSLVHDIPCA